MVDVEADGRKTIRSLAHMAAHAAQQRGVTEFTVTDHDLSQMVVEPIGFKLGFWKRWCKFVCLSLHFLYRAS